jgi:predicted secreted protein
MNPILGLAIYVIAWWLAFFTVLPIGAQSHSEAEEETIPGAEKGAPKAHRLLQKAVWAAVIAAIVWLFIAWAISVDLWNMRPNL